jgi:hypothetical protein
MWGCATLHCDRPVVDGDVTAGSLGKNVSLESAPCPYNLQYKSSGNILVLTNSIGLRLCAVEVCLLMGPLLFNDAVSS